MLRWFVAVLLPGSLCGIVCAGLAGCAKQPLPDITVRASSTEELAAFRSDLGARFAAEELQPFDTALNELRQEAMGRGIKTAAAREQEMQSVVNGKTVHDVLLLGWGARRSRLLDELKVMSELHAHDLKVKERTAATGTPESVLTHLQNQEEILARLRRDLADTERQLAAWGAPPGGK
jgi:hypothetical protein